MELINKKDALHAVLHNTGDAAVVAVQEIEAVDAVQVVHGEWIRHGCDEEEFEYYECPLCGFIGLDYNYCPNCGAKMDGERKDGADDERTD